MKQKNPKFEKVLFQAAYEGLNVIGNSVPMAIFPHLEKSGSIGPGNVISDPKAFGDSLRKIFGFGSKIIEKQILEILYEKLQISRKLDNSFSFDEEIENVKKIFRSTEVQFPLTETVNV
ncbi:MAG: hypothetical protein OEY22_10575 [Candidatus Bathyarchaeota archaeon]|nr:hypothetical protein [Candidatus Bathyarchaeota archaeon]MDH5787988.1 hypothetical protein [Candidatus Bathyarchaeota archaeon]